MSQLFLFDDPAITGRCPCGRELHWLYSPARPGAPWDEGVDDWSDGAEWAWCECSPRTVRAVVPAGRAVA